jgi:hypothetical protein
MIAAGLEKVKAGAGRDEPSSRGDEEFSFAKHGRATPYAGSAVRLTVPIEVETCPRSFCRKSVTRSR